MWESSFLRKSYSDWLRLWLLKAILARTAVPWGFSQAQVQQVLT